MIGLDQAITDSAIRVTLEQSGWRPDYRCDVEEWSEWLKAEGFSVHDFAIECLRKLGGFRIVPPASSRAVFASGVFLVDPQWAAAGENHRIKQREARLGVKLCPVGEWMDEYIVLVSDDGGVYAETTFEMLSLGRDLGEALRTIILADSTPAKVPL